MSLYLFYIMLDNLAMKARSYIIMMVYFAAEPVGF